MKRHSGLWIGSAVKAPQAGTEPVREFRINSDEQGYFHEK